MFLPSKAKFTILPYQAHFRNALGEINSMTTKSTPICAILQQKQTNVRTKQIVISLKNKWRSVNALTTWLKVTWKSSYLQQSKQSKVLNTTLNENTTNRNDVVDMNKRMNVARQPRTDQLSWCTIFRRFFFPLFRIFSFVVCLLLDYHLVVKKETTYYTKTNTFTIKRVSNEIDKQESKNFELYDWNLVFFHWIVSSAVNHGHWSNSREFWLGSW